MKANYEPAYPGVVRLGDRIAAIIANLPPALAEKVRADTERMIRESRQRGSATRRIRAERRSHRDRRGPWVRATTRP